MSVRQNWVTCNSCGLNVQDTIAFRDGWRHAGSLPGGKDWCEECAKTMPPHRVLNEHTGLVELTKAGLT